jgi:hypothetical protein
MMFIIGVNWGIRLQFAIYPFSDEAFELRGVITSSSISPLPKLNIGLADRKRCPLWQSIPSLAYVCNLRAPCLNSSCETTEGRD